MKKKVNIKIVIILFLLALGSGLFLLDNIFSFFDPKSEQPAINDLPSPLISSPSSATPISSAIISPRSSPTPTPRPSPAPTLLASIVLNVSFFAQAPFGEWDNPIFQDGCEEASVIMAMHWVNDTAVSKEQAKQEIIALSEFEDRTYGHAADRSAADTSLLFKDYYNFLNFKTQADISSREIKSALLAGNLVITPVNGRILKNPYYTPPGPEHHMIVIIGYDSKTDEFITNDIGTRHGEKFHYSASRLEDSLQDYPTGDHLPVIPGNTAMIPPPTPLLAGMPTS